MLVRRVLSASLAFGALCAVALGCASAPPSPAAAPVAPPLPPRPPAEPVGLAPAPAPASPLPAAPLPPPAGGEEPVADQPGEPEACPAGMKLVEGDYCTQVEQHCLSHWHDKSNDKKVCEKVASPSRCIGKRIKKRFCIDTYAWPNVQGERPEVMNNFYQAQVKCAAIGKRMCTESEWTFACEGPEMKPFPHGYVRDARKCNGDHRWDTPNMKLVAKRDPTELARLWRGVPSGSQPDCISDFGVADLPGNNDEVVAGETPRAKFDSVHTGGPWYKGVRNQCRPKIYTHDEGFYYYFLGFRCCSEPDGAPTDPRTPMQRRKRRKMDFVERLAGFTVEQMQRRLEEKKAGGCRCSAGDIKCKTMCGTLLGPSARDGDDSTREEPGKRP